MPIYRLPEAPVFPNPNEAEEDGILAVGGDLSVPRLRAAYCAGIFPWYSEDQPILWWSPDPRCVLFLHEFRVRDSLRRIVRGGRFQVTFDRDFAAVVAGCSRISRKDQPDTWITEDMQQAYIALHRAGDAHSVEVWQNEKLVGGLYGVAVGRTFCGESMFSAVSNASQVALVHLAQSLASQGARMMDCQFLTDHLAQFGAREISRREFLALLHENAQGSMPFHARLTI